MPVFTIETPTGQKLDIEAADQATAINGAKQWHSENVPPGYVLDKPPWEQNWSQSAKDTAYDVAASGAAGLGQGVANFAGALGDVKSALGGSRPVTDPATLARLNSGSPVTDPSVLAQLNAPPWEQNWSKGGDNSPPPPAGFVPDDHPYWDKAKSVAGTVARGAADFVAPGATLAYDYAPTSQQIQSGIEKVTGPFHQPTTEWGQYAKEGAAGIPGAMLGPEALATKAAIGIGSGVGGEFFANHFAGTPYEPYARMIGGIVGGVGTSAAGRGVEAVRNYSAASSAGRQIGAELGTDSIGAGAVRRAAQSAADDQLTPAGVTASQARLGPEAMVMDMGRQMQGRAEAIALPPGKAQNTVLDAVEDRTGEYGSGARSRIEQTLDQHLGPSQNVVKLMDDVDALVQKHAKPAYDQVMNNFPVINVPPEITGRPAVAQAMQRAQGLAANYGEKLGTQETRTILSGDGYHIADDVTNPAQPSLKYWDYVKKSMDQRINGMMKTGFDDLSSAEKADVGGLLNAKHALVGYLDGVTSGAYADARRIAATKPELHEAMDFGRSIFNTNLLPEEVNAHIQGLSIPEQAMVQVGARRELGRVLDSARNDGAKARSFLDTNNNTQKISSLFGPKAAGAIANRVGAENTFQDATQTIARNSRTATRAQLIQDTETSSPARIDTTLTGLALKPVKAGLAYALQHGMQNTRQGIADIVTARGPQINPVVEQLLNFNRKTAANASAPLSSQASVLVRALMSAR